MIGSADADADFDAAAAEVEAASRSALHEEETDSRTWVSSEECARAMMVDPEISRLYLQLGKADKWHTLQTEKATKLLLFFVVLFYQKRKGIISCY